MKQKICTAISIALFVFASVGTGCQGGGDEATSDTEASLRSDKQILERTGKTRAQHQEFAPFALFDFDGDGRLSAAEQDEAERAGLDVAALAELHKR